MPRLINTKLTAALALSGALQQINNTVIMSRWEQEMDGITQLTNELVSLVFQLQQDPSVLDKLESKLAGLQELIYNCRLGHATLATWERMYKVGKFEQLLGKLKEAKALVMAYRELPVMLERKPPRLRSAHPPAVATGMTATSAL